jgi:hypothetical protein
MCKIEYMDNAANLDGAFFFDEFADCVEEVWGELFSY